jgi:hypothetical protein
MTLIKRALLLFFSIVSLSIYAQTPAPAAASAPAHTYPRITGYVGIIHPLVTFGKEGTHTNFDESYTIGMPTGINIWKTPKIGFSFEVVPFIRAENGVSKMNNLLFHPGILTALGKGYTLVGRAAFETSGRYGLTPILNKMVKKNAHSNYFLALPLPVRFGNDRPATFGIGLQFGIGF